MNELELRNHVRELCERFGSIIGWSEENDLAHSSVSAFIRGERPPGPKLLKKIGFKKCYKYLSKGQKAVMKFEDI